MLILLLLSIFAASANSVVLHKTKLPFGGAVYGYNLIGAAVWCICLFLLNGGKVYLDGNVLLWGCVYGITQALFVLFKTLAMNSGQVSVTTLLGNCSLLVSVIISFIIWDEPVFSSDIAGLLLLMFGILLTTLKNSGGKLTKKWFVIVTLFFVCASAVGIIFKAFSKSNVGHVGDMMLVSAVCMLASFTIFSLFGKGFGGTSHGISKKERHAFVFAALISGLLSCLYNRLNIYLSGALDGVIFFSAFNGGVIVLSTVLSVLFLRERLSIRQIVGLIAGVSGICIIGIF